MERSNEQSRDPPTQNATGTVLPPFEEEKIAQRFARQIERYWAGVGYPTVRCRVERVTQGLNRSWSYEIRSNLIRGLPPGG
jgi:hypothetical protein